jgi:WD40 repeat protein
MVAFSLGGKYLATVSFDRTAPLWDVATGRQLRVFMGHRAEVNDVAFAPDGKSLFTASGDFTARLWDIPFETEPRMFIGHRKSGADSDLVRWQVCAHSR